MTVGKIFFSSVEVTYNQIVGPEFIRELQRPQFDKQVFFCRWEVSRVAEIFSLLRPFAEYIRRLANEHICCLHRKSLLTLVLGTVIFLGKHIKQEAFVLTRSSYKSAYDKWIVWHYILHNLSDSHLKIAQWVERKYCFWLWLWLRKYKPLDIEINWHKLCAVCLP